MKVKIIKCGKLGWWYANKIGEVFEIYHEHVNSNCYIIGDGIGININDCEIIKYDKMTKQDLITGMLVEYANSTLYRVLLDTEFGDRLVNNYTHNGLHHHNDDLTSKNHADHHIVKVYSPESEHALKEIDTKNYNLL